MAIVCSVSSGPPHPPSPFRRWGLPDAAFWFLVAQFGGALGYLLFVRPDQPEVQAGVQDAASPISNTTIPMLFLASIGIWIGYGAGPLITSYFRGRGPLADYGAELRAKDVPGGLLLGAFTQLVLVWILYWPILRWLVEDEPGQAARELTDRVDGPADAWLLTLMVALAAPIAEELFYRGLLLGALRFHFGDWTSVLLSSGIFAVVHLQLLSLPGLFMFGVIAGVLRVKTGRLGPSILFHIGFNLATVIILLEPWN